MRNYFQLCEVRYIRPRCSSQMHPGIDHSNTGLFHSVQLKTLELMEHNSNISNRGKLAPGRHLPYAEMPLDACGVALLGPADPGNTKPPPGHLQHPKWTTIQLHHHLVGNLTRPSGGSTLRKSGTRVTRVADIRMKDHLSSSTRISWMG